MDEIFLDLINSTTPENVLEQEIDELLCTDKREEVVISECVAAIGEYIKKLLQCIGGKMYFELLVIYAYDAKKRQEIIPRLKYKQSFEYAQNRIIAYLTDKVQKGIFNPVIPVNSIMMFTCVTIDGISTDAAISAVGGNSENVTPVVDVSEMFSALAKTIINFLGA